MALDIINIMTGFVVSGLLAYFIEGREVLTLGGLVASIFLGTIVYGLGGPQWLGILLAFFLSSSALTSIFSKEKEKVNREQFEKGGTRDMWQVIANGGLSSLLVAAYFLSPQPVYFIAFIGVLASVNADTWATEIGILSKSQPLLLTTFKPVEKGRSGGVTVVGTAASFFGALFLACCAVALTWYFQPSMLASIGPWKILTATVLGGFFGALFDSFLGATIQAQNFCPNCRKLTEQRTHHCGTKTWHKMGIEAVDNDIVNLFSSLFGGFAAAVIFILL